MSKVAFIHHSVREMGDHAMEVRQTVFFETTGLISALHDFLEQNGGTLELTKQLDGQGH